MSRWVMRWKWAVATMALALGGIGTSAFAATLQPVVDGAARDVAPQTGAADSLLPDSPLVSNVNGNQYRAIKEFDISSFAGGTVVAATLRGSVVPNNSADTGERGHRFEVYPGNGTLDLSDYSVAGDEAGMLSHPSGGRSNHRFDVTSELAALAAASASHAGVRVSPINSFQGFDVAVDTELDVFAVPAGSTLASLTPTVDAQGFFPVGAAPVEFGGHSILAWDRTSGNDERAIMEFDLAGVPNGATVTAAWIELDVNLLTYSDFSYPEPRFYGYGGNGGAEMSDAGQTSLLLGQAPPTSDLGLMRVELSPAAVQTVLNGGASHFGLLAVGSTNNQQFGFSTSESMFSEPPRLQLAYEYVEPQSADYNDDGSVNAADYTVWRDSLGTPGDLRGDGTRDGQVGPEDYELWKSQYGMAGPPEIANGDFASGNLDGWTNVTTPNGREANGFPRVESFDVDGDGTSSLAYRTNAGQQVINFGVPAGAGIAQDVVFASGGDFQLTADVASQNLSGGNNAGPGRFELRFDGALVDVVDFNSGPSFANGQVLRDSLSATLSNVTPGTHRVEILILKPYVVGVSIFQYLDDIQLTAIGSATAVPEPGTLAGGVIGGVAMLARRSRAKRKKAWVL